MSEQENIAPAEVPVENQPASQAEVPATTTETKEETIGNLMHEEPAQEKEQTVPLPKFLQLKGEKKALERELRDYKNSIEEGASDKEVSKSSQEIADQYGVDVDFLEAYAKKIRKEVKQEMEQDIDSKLKPLAEKEKASKINEAFKTHYSKALEAIPEYNGVVKEDVIKALSLIPANSSKTFTQLIEETYGHLIQGKRSIDGSSNKNSKNDSGEIDTEKARRDPAYFKEIMDNPALKKKYNESMTDRISSIL